MPDLQEAATVRARARAAARALKELLADKALPAELRKQVENLHSSMGKTWADLEADAKLDPERQAKESALAEAANMGAWLEAMLHLRLTEMADYAYADGRLTRDERKAVSHAVGQALDIFRATLEADAIQLYARGPYAQPEEAEVSSMMAAGEALAPDNGEALSGEYVPLVEKSVRRDGTIPVKIIAPGWGSSGYYAADMLEKNAARFGPGVKMYWNHPTASEERERPERDLRDLAGETVTPARWEAQGPAGPGLYAEAKVFEPYQKAVDELGPHIGVSIRALGKASVGQAEGRSGKMINEISQVASVDFVTQPGAGGQVLQIFEARRQSGPVGQTPGDEKKNVQNRKEVEVDDLKKLQEANSQLESKVNEQAVQISRLSEALLLNKASEMVKELLAKYAGLPEMTRSRLQAQMAGNPPLKEGRLDVVALGDQVQQAVKAELEYLAEAAGLGQVRGMGASAAAVKIENVESELDQVFQRMGLSEAAAKQAAKGR